MKGSVFILYALIMASSSVQANSLTTDFVPSEKRCQKVADKITKLNASMRKGYSQKQGETLRGSLRALKKHKHQCDKKKFATS